MARGDAQTRLVEAARRAGVIGDEGTTGDGERLDRLIESGGVSPTTLRELYREAGVADDAEGSFEAGDRWRIVRKLGEGGMGRVFLAEDRLLDRRVALKFLHRAHADAWARLLREARAQAKVEHPHVCKVYEVGTAAGRDYIAMQLIDGPPLGQLAPTLDLAEKLAIIIDIARAVHAAHEQGLIHRDLKPGNIVVERGPEGPHAFVTDFGIALELDEEAVRLRRLSGTPDFMAPEQLAHGRVDRRADVYALGATLYTCLGGKLVDPTRSTGNEAHPAPRPSARTLRPRVPRDLAAIIDRCMDGEPCRRFATAAELADALARVRLPGPRPWRRRLAASAAVAVAVAALATSSSSRRPSPPAPPQDDELPRNSAAVPLYRAGIGELHLQEAAAAIRDLRAAVVVDAGFAPAHEALSEAYLYLGHDAEAQREARVAVALSETRTPSRRRWAQARLLEAERDFERAAELYERLWQEQPDELEVGLHLGYVYWRGGDPAGERRVLRELSRIPAASADPRIAGMNLTVAFEDGKRRLAWTLAERLRAAGQRAQSFAALKIEASILWSRGLYDLAATRAEWAIALATELEDPLGADWTRFLAAQIELDRGRLDGADAALAPLGAAGSSSDDVRVNQVTTLAGVALARGDVARARGLLEDALEWSETTVGGREARANLLEWLGAAMLSGGDLAAARRLLGDSLDLMRALGWRGRVAAVSARLAEIEADAGDHAGARARLREAQSIWIEREAPVEELRVRLALARLALDEGDAAAAEATARLATTWWAAYGLSDERARATALLADALVAQGRADEAARLCDAGVQTQVPAVRLAVAIAGARARGDRSRVAELAEEAERLGQPLMARRARR